MPTAEDRAHQIARYAAGHDDLVATLAEIPREMWGFRPADREWSIREILMHVVDSEPGAFVELRKIVAEPGSRVSWFDQDRWAARLPYAQQNIDAALEVLRWLRRANHDLLSHLSPEAWECSVELDNGGRYTLDRWLRVYTSHVPTHIAQMRDVHAAWLRYQAEPPST